MAAVVALHCVGVLPPLCGINGSSRLIYALGQPFKFGTIGFFLISGFLMGEGLSRSSSSAYLTRRLKRVFAPWLVWFALYAALSLAHHVVTGRLSMDSLDGFRMIPGLVRIDLFSTAYWFVPNLMIAVSVLLLCRRFLYDPRLGCALLGLSLFYGVNAYSQWIPIQNHSEAFLGFAFYLWLGAWTAKHFAAFMAWIARIPLLALLVLAVLTGLAAFGEAEVLTDRGAMNTLRISNQIYSVLAVLAIFKARGGLWPRALNVRASTFGIYLTHSVVLALLINLSKPIPLQRVMGNAGIPAEAYAIVLLPGSFIATYLGSLAITQLLLRYPYLCWMVGGSKLGGSPKRTRAEEVRTPGQSFSFWRFPLPTHPASHLGLPTDSAGHGD